MTTPHDDALLYDLADERLAPAAAEEVRRRIAEEPDLAAAWDDIQRLREGLRSLPRPATPAGFLEGVRARAGLPPLSAPATPPAPIGAPAPTGSMGTPRADGAPAGRVYRMRPLAYAVAACALFGIGVGAYWLGSRGGGGAAGPSPDRGNPPVADRRADSEKTSPDADAARTTARTADEWKAAAGRASGASPGPSSPPAPAGPPHFVGPIGAVTPGIRPPSDVPVPPAGRGATPAGGGGPVTSPAAPPVVPPAEPAAASAPARTTVPAPETARAGGGGAAPRGAAADAEKRFDPAAHGSARKKTEAADPLAWASEGVEEACTIRAASLDEARAEVALLRLSWAAAGSALDDVSRDAKEGAKERPTDKDLDRDRVAGASRLALKRLRAQDPAAAAGEDRRRGDRAAGADASAAPSGSGAPSPPAGGASGLGKASPPPTSPADGAPPPVVLGSFVVPVSPAEEESLSRSLGGKGVPPAEGFASSPRRLRIVVLAR